MELFENNLKDIQQAEEPNEAHDTGQGRDRPHGISLILVYHTQSTGEKNTLMDYA